MKCAARRGSAGVHFRRAVILSHVPNRALTEARNRLFLASALQAQGDAGRDSARAELRAAFALFRTTNFEPTFLMYLGKALARDGQLVLAREVYDSMQRRAQADNRADLANARLLAGELALAAGLADSAVHLVRLAVAADSAPYARESLARALARAGDVIGAARMYDALAAAPAKWYGWEAEQFGLAAPVEAGRLYEQLGDTARARRAYETLIARWPTADTNLVFTRTAREGVKRLAVVRR